jgi:hypothetical protein
MPFTETDLQILARQHLNCGDAAFTPIAGLMSCILVIKSCHALLFWILLVMGIGFLVL